MKGLQKALVSVCCLLLLLTLFVPTVFAAEYEWSVEHSGPAFPNVTHYTWYALEKATKTEQTPKYFIITTTAGGYTEQLYVSLPAEGGFRLQSKHEHQQTVEESNVGLFEPKSISTIDYKKDVAGTVIMTGADGSVLRYKEHSDGFSFELCNNQGKRIIGISNEQISFAYDLRKDVVKTMVEMSLVENEGIYQGGERFNSANQVGSYTSLQNVDVPSAEDMAYVNVPLFHSNRGYSIWFNMTYSGNADIGWSDEHKYSVEFVGDKLDFFVWTGTPLENLKKYTALTGTSGMYNEWTFGYWAGAGSQAYTNNGTENALVNMEKLLEGYAENYNFYPEALFAEGDNSKYAANIQFQKERGVRTLYWYQPYVENAGGFLDAEQLSQFPTFDKNGNMLSTGWPYKYDTWLLEKYNIYKFAQATWIDHSNPSVVDLIRNRLIQYMDWGVSGAMLDYGEYTQFYGTAFNGLLGSEMHNLDSYYYAQSAQTVFQDFWNGDYVLFQRSGCAGTQYFVGNFLGDQYPDWEGYHDQITAMISMGASGYNLYGGDLGGYGGVCQDNDLFSRWTVLSTFSPWMRQHGLELRMPWEKGEGNKNNFGKYYYFRKNIVPTVMSAAMDANKTSNPIVKGMMVAYPYQLKLVDVDNQYLFCDDFLVCAVTETAQHTLDVALPNGDTWYNLFTYERLLGGQTVTVEAPTAFMPVYVKDGAVKAINLPESLALSAEMHDEGDYGYSEELAPHASLLITPPDEERTSTIHVMDGDVVDFRTYDSHTEVYTSKPVTNSTFTITNTEGSPRNTVLALGVTASEISYDGQTLDRLDHIPDYFQEEYGYYVELSGLTTIYLPTGWNELRIVKGKAEYAPYKAFLLNDKSDSTLFDNNPETTYTMPISRSRNVLIQLNADEPQKIGRVVVKWAQSYLSSYDVEYSVDGKEWQWLSGNAESEHTIVEGGGSFDVIELPITETVEAKYLRIVPVERAKDILTTPSAYAVEIYPPDEFRLLAADDSANPEYDDEDLDDVWDDLGDESNGKGKRKKVIIRTTSVWVIIAIVGGGVLVATGILLLILLLLKRKKRRDAATAEAAEESMVEDVLNESSQS